MTKEATITTTTKTTLQFEFELLEHLMFQLN